MAARFDLDRFVAAQDPVIATVQDELRAGHKQTHWMWFVFPQVEGLGSSPTARRYAIASLEEAKAYLAHPILGARLRHCTALVLQVDGKTARQIFGQPDDMKFRSSMTLFALAGTDPVYAEAIRRYFGGEFDPLTVARVRAA
jgi:uncharacterized protein (DUF1810 family)